MVAFKKNIKYRYARATPLRGLPRALAVRLDSTRGPDTITVNRKSVNPNPPSRIHIF